MSINTHLGREQSRRDDLEALGHVFFYFLRGQLPWQGLKAPTNKQKYEKIGEKKRTTGVSDLGAGFPPQFAQYLDAVRNLQFEETPNYEGYRKLLRQALGEEKLDGKYDWMKLNGGKGWDLNINKKPNLHGYGHPTPPDKDRHQRNPQQRRNRHLQQQLQLAQAQQHQPQFAGGAQNPQQQQEHQRLQAQLQQQQQQSHHQLNNVYHQKIGLPAQPINSTMDGMTPQQFQSKQPTPIREKVNSNNTFGNGNGTQQGDNNSLSSKKGFMSKLLCCN